MTYDNELTTGGYYYDKQDGVSGWLRRNVDSFMRELSAGGLGRAAVVALGTAAGGWLLGQLKDTSDEVA